MSENVRDRIFEEVYAGRNGDVYEDCYEATDRILSIITTALRGTEDWDKKEFDYTAVDAGIQALRDIPFNRGEARLVELDKRSSVIIMLDAMFTAAGLDHTGKEKEQGNENQ